jgi:hypothetical protein
LIDVPILLNEEDAFLESANRRAADEIDSSAGKLYMVVSGEVLESLSKIGIRRS